MSRFELARPLFVFSHLRWPFVWQRPQHLISRLRSNRQCWFIEEPVIAEVRQPAIRTEDASGLLRVWLELPADEFDATAHLGFGGDVNRAYAAALRELRPPSGGIAWLYSPAALDIARSLRPATVVYDVMDDLSAFRGAPPALRVHHVDAAQAADVVFAGGRSLFTRVSRHAPSRTHLFASGVDPEHYAKSRALRAARHAARPVAGYLGVIDERLDLELIGALARMLPDWTVRLVGPVAKIDERDVPEAPNIERIGLRRYDELPAVLGDFDVALMPFALNEATAAISPTKTLEYFAAGLPVVSTRVPDVVADFPLAVTFADDAGEFAGACRAALSEPAAPAMQDEIDRVVAEHTWDAIADRMHQLIVESTDAKLRYRANATA